MQLQTSNLSQRSQLFLSSTSEDTALIKLHKYRHYLLTKKQTALQLFNGVSQYALDHNLIGQYELLYETLKQDIEKTQKYKNQRQQVINVTNPLRQQIQHSQSISAFQQTAHLYYKIAIYYKSVAMHRQSSNYFNKLFRLQSTSTSKIIYPRSQYFSSWAQQLYFDNNYGQLGIFVRNQIEDQKKIDVNLMLIKDLKYIQMDRAQSKFFQNLLSMSNPGDITKNDIISLEDLGLLYSLTLLAKKDRQTIKRKVSWSSNIQVLYLQNNFKKLLSKFEDDYLERGMFHPLIDKFYKNCIEKIRQRILVQYLSAYTTISLNEIEKNTTFRQGELLQYLYKHTQLPYLIDPITQSLVYKQKTIPLYQETVEYGYRVKQKWREMIRSCINSRKLEQGENQQLTGDQGNRGLRGTLFGDRRQGSQNRDDWEMM